MSILQMRTVKYIFLTILLSMVALPCYAQDKITTIEKIIGTSTYQTTLGEDNDKVIIGKTGDSLTRLSPVIKLTKWNEEESLTLTYPGFSNLLPTISADGTITIGNSSIGFYINRADDTNLKFGLILKKKPVTNVFTFQLTGWENFDFYYQPPLTEEWKEGDLGGKIVSVTETACYDKDGNVLVNRPEHIIGSYVIYHKTKRDYYIGGTNYQTGQAGIILRPIIRDADNNILGYAVLSINNGVYTVTVPQSYIDNGKYPLKFNDTFGYTTAGGSSFTVTNFCQVMRSTNSVTGTATAISIYIRNDSSTTAYNVNMGLYNHDSVNNYPEDKLVETGDLSIPASFLNWKTQAIADTALSDYTWIAANQDSGHIIYYYNSVAGRSGREDAAGTTLPANFGDTPAAMYDLYSVSFYGTYTPGGGGGDDGGTTAGAMRRDRRVIIFD